MQEVQLYIQGQKVDLFSDETISLTSSIQNIRDISKIFTDFSKQFNIPASKNNNKIFKHYYNYDITNGFDARYKVDALIKLNGVDFRKGKVRLNSVSLKDNAPNTYKIVFFGDTVSLSDLLGGDELSDLTNLNTLSGDYDYSSMKDALQLDPNTNDLIVPLISVKEQFYYDSATALAGTKNLHYSAGVKQGISYTDLKYALRIDTILNAIQSKYNITFSDDFFNVLNKAYYNLFMWLSKTAGELKGADQFPLITTKVDGWANTTSNTEAYMTSSRLRLGSGWDAYRENNELNGTVKLTTNTTSSTLYNINVYKDGVLYYAESNLVGSTNRFLPNPFSGDYTLEITTTDNIGFSKIEWIATTATTYTFDTGGFVTNLVSTFTISANMPKIKIIDFLIGIFKMFNLTAYIENDIIVVRTLDSFYNAGNTHNITKYIDTNNSDIDSSLPFKNILLKYSDTKSYLASQHLKYFKEDWGGVKYDGNDNFDGSSYTLTVPFSHMKYERLLNLDTELTTTIQWGYSVNDSKSVYSGAPLLFYPYLQSGGESVSYLLGLFGVEALTTYNIPSNSLDINSNISKVNINFNSDINEYTGSTGFTDTLFEVYYKTYIENLFNIKARIFNLTCYLPLSILLKYNLNDRFVISGKKYKINSVNTNLQTGKSKLELINDFTIADIEAPTVPTNIIISGETQTTLTANWDASIDNVFVKNYDVYVDSVYYYTTQLTTIEITSLTENTIYNIQVLARDSSDNVSALSTGVNGTTLLASSPPTVPANLTVTNYYGLESWLDIAWDASTDDTGIDYYNLWRSVNGGSFSIKTSTSSLSYRDKSTAIGNTYCYKIEAIDLSAESSGLSTEQCKTA